MYIAEVMTTTVKTCSPNDTLQSAACAMRDQDCGALPVVDDQMHVLGMITDRDICLAACREQRVLDDLPVSHAMSRSIYWVSPRESVANVERMMQNHQIRRIPVVSNEQLVGIVSIGDLARAARSTKARETTELNPEQIGETLAGVSERRTGSAQIQGV